MTWSAWWMRRRTRRTRSRFARRRVGITLTSFSDRTRPTVGLVVAGGAKRPVGQVGGPLAPGQLATGDGAQLRAAGRDVDIPQDGPARRGDRAAVRAEGDARDEAASAGCEAAPLDAPGAAHIPERDGVG